MNRYPQSRALELFFIDGKPDGMQTAEVNDWQGHVLLAPRNRIDDALRLDQAKHRGVYLLLGDDESGDPLLYVGESKNMAERLRDHEKKKKWWISAVLITRQTNTLNSSHSEYLEARLLETAKSVGRIRLDNVNQPDGESHPEKIKHEMDAFLDTLMMVLPAMQIDCFLEQSSRPTVRVTPNQNKTTVFELFNKKHYIKATMIIQDKQYVVQKGSQARDKWYGEQNHTYRSLHQELMDDDVLRKEENYAVFTCDCPFTKPSAAGAVVTGRPTNGRVEWKERGTGKTLKDWEKENL